MSIPSQWEGVCDKSRLVVCGVWNVEDSHASPASQLSLSSGSGERLVPRRQSEVLEPVVVGNRVEPVLFPVPVPEIPGLAAGSGRIRINGPQRQRRQAPQERGSVEPLPESDKKAGRQEPARDGLSLAWDETLTNNPMTPRSRPVVCGHRGGVGSCRPPKAVPNQRRRLAPSLPFHGLFPRFFQGSAESAAVRWTDASPLLRCRSTPVPGKTLNHKLALVMVFLSAYSGETAFR